MMNDDNLYKEVVLMIRRYKVISLGILLVCIGIAGAFAMSRPVVYQSKLTFAVRLNQPMSDKARKNARLQEISQIAVSEDVRKPVSSDGLLGKYDIEKLNEDYRTSNIRVQNLQTLNMFRIFAHGSTPEEAQRICLGVYEHIAAFSEKYNKFEIDGNTPEGSLLEYVQNNLNDSKEEYTKYLSQATDNSSDVANFDEKKKRLYDNYMRWDGLYQDLLREDLLEKWNDSWRVELIDEANLPAEPIAKRTGFIMCIGFISGAVVCLLFGAVMVSKRSGKNIDSDREIS